MKPIRSESRFVWQTIFFIISLPVLIIQIIAKKRKASELVKPLKQFFIFIYEAKATFYLIIANLVIFLIEIMILTINPDALNQFIFQPQHLWTFQPIPIVASWFLHAGILHLLGNMLFLFIFGRVVEKEFGVNMLYIYFAAAIIADILSVVMGFGGIGASGAIAGLIVTGILLKPFYITYVVGGIPLPLFLVGWFAILADITGILLPKETMVNHFAHLGGYLAILLIIFFVSTENKKKMIKGFWINLAILILVWLFGFLV